MKNLIIILMIVGYICSNCSNPSMQSNNVTSNANDTAGYYAARNMKGLASFKIGETTYKQALNIIKDEIRKDSKRYKESNYKETPRYHGYEEKFQELVFDKTGNNIIRTYYREYFDLIIKEVEYDTLKSYLNGDIYDKKSLVVQKLKELIFFNTILVILN